MIGTVSQSKNFTIVSAFAQGFVYGYMKGGPISYISTSDTNLIFACIIKSGMSYSTGPIGFITG